MILIVDDERDTRTGLAEIFESWGYGTQTAASSDEALDRMENTQFEICISDLMHPGMNGVELMRIVSERYPEMAFILLSGWGTISNRDQAIREGAYDWLAKPVDWRQLKVTIERAIEYVELCRDLHRLRLDLATFGKCGSMVGHSPAMNGVYCLMRQVASSAATVLVTGERGTGKGIVARTLHEMSPRRSGPLKIVSCAQVSDTRLTREIFGYATDMHAGMAIDCAGLFELADGGTLFLEDVDGLSPELQSMLSRVLDTRTLRRVGTRETALNVRVIASMHLDISGALQSGTLREELFYRLGVVTIHLPPLRDRGDDILLLAEHCLKECAELHNRDVNGFTSAAQEAIRAYQWPGNVSELTNVIERAVIIAKKHSVDVKDLVHISSRKSWSKP